MPTRSFWEAEAPAHPPLRADTTTEVCVIGGGIAGLSIAHELALRGRAVVLVEMDRLGSGETGRTTAHLSDVMDEGLERLIDVHGAERARLIVESHRAAIETIARHVEQGIDCDFRRLPGYIYAGVEVLEREHEAGRRLGLEGRRRNTLVGPALRFDDQAQFHPLRYLHGLAKRFEQAGGRIHEGTRATAVEAGRVKTDGGTIRCDDVVVATNTPFTEGLGVHAKQAAYRTYALAFRVEPEHALDALYWSTDEPYDYIRGQEKDGDHFVIFGGRDHRTGHADTTDRHSQLEVRARRLLPFLGDVAASWSGQVVEPADGIAYIGRHEGVYIVSGDSGQGMTHGVLSSLLIADAIEGRTNRFADLYDPDRTPRAMGELVREAARTNASYLRWLEPGQRLSSIPVGEGRIVRSGMRLMAVHRAGPDDYRIQDATCTHLRGVVAWNAAEKTWDCPVHGSRFGTDGQVVCGPASHGLGRVGRLSLHEAEQELG